MSGCIDKNGLGVFICDGEMVASHWVVRRKNRDVDVYVEYIFGISSMMTCTIGIINSSNNYEVSIESVLVVSSVGW